MHSYWIKFWQRKNGNDFKIYSEMAKAIYKTDEVNLMDYYCLLHKFYNGHELVAGFRTCVQPAENLKYIKNINSCYRIKDDKKCNLNKLKFKDNKVHLFLDEMNPFELFFIHDNETFIIETSIIGFQEYFQNVLNIDSCRYQIINLKAIFVKNISNYKFIKVLDTFQAIKSNNIKPAKVESTNNTLDKSPESTNNILDKSPKLINNTLNDNKHIQSTDNKSPESTNNILTDNTSPESTNNILTDDKSPESDTNILTDNKSSESDTNILTDNKSPESNTNILDKSSESNTNILTDDKSLKLINNTLNDNKHIQSTDNKSPESDTNTLTDNKSPESDTNTLTDNKSPESTNNILDKSPESTNNILDKSPESNTNTLTDNKLLEYINNIKFVKLTITTKSRFPTARSRFFTIKLSKYSKLIKIFFGHVR